ncbi:hypothetical protein C8J57DRAFT_1220906 [Mycena rebaudengoi]|nr:hypothetical protein C8J57DRAFT_1220906 [Mycena rebaudengoi]
MFMDLGACVEVPASLLEALLHEFPQWRTKELPALDSLKKILVTTRSQSTSPTLANNGESQNGDLNALRLRGGAVTRSAAAGTAAKGGGKRGGKGDGKCDQRKATKLRKGRQQNLRDRGAEASAQARAVMNGATGLRGGAGSEGSSTPEPADDGEYVEVGGNKRKKADRGDFIVNKRPQKATAQGGRLLAYLAAAHTEEGQARVDLLAQNCHRLHAKNAKDEFTLIMSLVQLRLALHRSTIPDDKIAKAAGMQSTTLSTYKRHSMRLLAFAGGGTFYTLIVIAALGLRTKITAGSIHWPDVDSAANTLRDPSAGDSWSETVTAFIIPVIQHLYQNKALQDVLVFGKNAYKLGQLQSWTLQLNDVCIKFSKLKINDALTDRLETKRSVFPLGSAEVGTHHKPQSIEDRTGGNHSIECYSARKSNWKERTAEAWEHAENAPHMHDLAELGNHFFLPDGVHV